jgi:dTDP-4-amino-4,6-dideoxygalactose transaminase
MKFKLPFSGRAHSYDEIEIKTVVETMESAEPLTQGTHRNQFEASFVNFQGGKGKAFAVGSATDALEITAQLCQFEHGDEFIIPAHTYTASCYPFIKKGGTPVWADIDLETRVVTAETIEKCVTPKTKAIVVVHLYGYAAEIAPIIELAKSKNLTVIEDAAQAIGSIYKENRVGSLADFGIFSFHSHKNMSTLGEGGMLWVNDSKIAEQIPLLRHNGHCDFDFEREDYWIPAMGNVDLPQLNGKTMMPNNYCLGEVQCALGQKLLERVDKINSEKRRRALLFINELKNFPEIEFHKVENDRHNYHLLVAKLANGKRNDFIRIMSKRFSIQCVVQYFPLNRYDLYAKLGYGNADIPNTDNFFDNMVSFPFQQTLTDSQLSYMIDSTQEVLQSFR